MARDGSFSALRVGEQTRPHDQGIEDDRSAVHNCVLVVAGGEPVPDVALLAERTMRDGRATAYVCRGYACDEPTTSGEALAAQLAEAGRSRS